MAYKSVAEELTAKGSGLFKVASKKHLIWIDRGTIVANFKVFTP